MLRYPVIRAVKGLKGMNQFYHELVRNKRDITSLRRIRSFAFLILSELSLCIITQVLVIWDSKVPVVIPDLFGGRNKKLKHVIHPRSLLLKGTPKIS